jgi:glutamine amidotransferase
VRLALVDYGAGNLTSVLKALHFVGAEVRVISRTEDMAGTDALVVPGVGHFAATASLGPEWKRAAMKAIDDGMPMLGICLGMQWLFEGSAEAPEVPGLGFVPGRCFRIEGAVKVPHVGWNTLAPAPKPSRLLDGLASGASAYFTHSYACPCGDDTAAITTHAVPFSSAVERGRVFGVQFHPEKSGKTGLKMLTNFMRVAQGELTGIGA